jgi:hypothetical protein
MTANGLEELGKVTTIVDARGVDESKKKKGEKNKRGGHEKRERGEGKREGKGKRVDETSAYGQICIVSA